MRQSQEYPVSEIVPDGYRANPLPDDVREWVDKQSQELSQAYELSKHGDRWDFDEEQRKQFEQRGWNWWGEGTERTVAELGRTLNGSPVFYTFDRVVIKFKPINRPVDGLSAGVTREERTITRATANIHELTVWKWACDHGDEDKFATILDYGEYGDWVAQKYHVPIYPYNHSSAHAKTVDHDYIHDEWGVLEPFNDEMKQRGYDVHLKDGNVGMDPETRDVVCIDSGDHCRIDGVDNADLIEYCLNG